MEPLLKHGAICAHFCANDGGVDDVLIDHLDRFLTMAAFYRPVHHEDPLLNLDPMETLWIYSINFLTFEC